MHSRRSVDPQVVVCLFVCRQHNNAGETGVRAYSAGHLIFIIYQALRNHFAILYFVHSGIRDTIASRSQLTIE